MSNFSIQRCSVLPQEKIFDISIDVENFHKIMPNHFKSLDIIEENKYAICTTSIGKTAGTTKRSEWSDAAEKRYEKCKDDLEESEELEETASMSGAAASGFSGISFRRKKSKRRPKTN